MTWSEPRPYSHFDQPITPAFADKVQQSGYAASHSFSPLIRSDIDDCRYRLTGNGKERRRQTKRRAIYAASHRDAAVFGFAAVQLSEALERYYSDRGLSHAVAAYRSPGISNYETAARAYGLAKARSPVVFMTYDITDFFDSLDHRILKAKWKHVLQVEELPADSFAIFRATTKFSFVQRASLSTVRAQNAGHPSRHGWTIRQVIAEQVPILPNPTSGKGVPQGVPISQVLSNLYMIDFDSTLNAMVDAAGGSYCRYGDDILVVCDRGDADRIDLEISLATAREELTLNSSKARRRTFDWSSPNPERPLQYLGFDLSERGAWLRCNTLGRQWERMLACYEATVRKGAAEIAVGKASKVYTRKFRQRFVSADHRNFLSYAFTAASAFGSDEKITGQVRRLRRQSERKLSQLNKKRPRP